VADKLGARIREYRKAAQLTSAGLAHLARIDPAALLRIERGENTRPSFETIGKIADALGLSLDDLRPSSTSVKPGAVETIRREEELREVSRIANDIADRLKRIIGRKS